MTSMRWKELSDTFAINRFRDMLRAVPAVPAVPELTVQQNNFTRTIRSHLHLMAPVRSVSKSKRPRWSRI